MNVPIPANTRPPIVQNHQLFIKLDVELLLVDFEFNLCSVEIDADSVDETLVEEFVILSVWIQMKKKNENKHKILN